MDLTLVWKTDDGHTYTKYVSMGEFVALKNLFWLLTGHKVTGWRPTGKMFF